MKISLLNLRYLLLLMMTCSLSIVNGQVTTSSITGTVKDSKGETLPGATVAAIHEPSGSRYGTISNQSGLYFIPNMRVGGPYTIRISFIGSEDRVSEGIYLTLGQSFKFDATLDDRSQALSEVVVLGNKNDLLDADKTGAATNVSRETIQAIPNISRGLKDFTKLSPLANTNGSGTSFAGTNNRYNQFSIDGLVNNDVFGLSSSGTNGGQAGTEPISLDAIEEFQINIAPYDVRQSGFTGGGINAVTRSGNNSFQGSVYYFGNSQDLVGPYNAISGNKSKVPDYKNYQRGFRLGGPIVKNKLFFFVNAEQTSNVNQLLFNPYQSGSGSNITVAEIDRVIAAMGRIAPNYDLGTADRIQNETTSDKILAKLDWNINSRHKLSLRHSYTEGLDVGASRGTNSLRFSNNGFAFPSKTNSTGLELNSSFGTNMFNNLLIGYTSVKDDREPIGGLFPATTIYLTGGRTIEFGSEFSSVANLLEQNIFSITDNFNIYAGKHTLTFGTNNEFYNIYNQFVQNIYGNYAYRSLEDFETVGTPGQIAPSYYQVNYSFATDDNPSQSKGAADFNAMQLGLYAQDEIQLSDKLKISLGLRADMPIFKNDPPVNNAFATSFPQLNTLGIRTNRLPESKILFSPRFGFNYDVLGDNSFKIRGGTGIFTGRVPLVWVSNQYTNNGVVNGSFQLGNRNASSSPIAVTGGVPVRYETDPFEQPLADTYGRTPGLGDINITSPSFQFPQSFRTNIGIDKKLPFGLVGTIEGIYSKGINNVNFKNLNRGVDLNFAFTGPDNRPRYNSGRTVAAFNEVIVLESNNEGYTYNMVFQIQKPLSKGISGSIAYVNGRSTDLNSGTSSTAFSNWRFANSVNGPNDLEATLANFHVPHRVTGYLTYRKEYLKNMLATQVSLFYNGQSGQPFSYIYNGDMNNDGTSNDLIYVPRDQSEIVFVPQTASTTITNPLNAQQQWELFNSYIDGDSYLKDRRGKYAERNGASTPFQHQFDFRFMQDFAIRAGNTINRLQFSFDILNFGNLINKDWGRSYSVTNQTFSLLNYNSLDADGTTPRYQYTAAGQTNGKPYVASDFNSRWRAQVGLRYIFN